MQTKALRCALFQDCAFAVLVLVLESEQIGQNLNVGRRRLARKNHLGLY